MDTGTRIHPETGKLLHRDIRPIEFTYKGETVILDMPGWYPEDKNDDDAIFSWEDMEMHDKALDILQERIRQKNLDVRTA